VSRWVYYCVDDFAEWPGLDQATLGRMEEEMVVRVDDLIAAGEQLRGRLLRMGRHAHLLTHGVELDFWQAAPAAPAPAVAHLPRPLILFWGLVDRRMDVAFLRRLTADLAQ